MSELEVLYPQIPFNATSMQESDATATGYSTYNLVTGSRSLLHKLNAQATALFNTWKQWDLGYGATDTANYIALARADLLRASGCTSATIRASTVSRTTISDLALSSLKLWLTTDKGITINSTRQVSQWDDQSGNGYNFTQSTSGNKPLLSRADNKENLVQYSEQFDNAVWLKNTSTVTANAASSPLSSTATAESWIESTSGAVQPYLYQNVAVYSGISYRISVYVKNLSGTRYFYLQVSGGAIATKSASFNISSGTVGTVSASATSSIESIGNGWYRCTLTVTPTTTSTFDVTLGISNADAYYGSYTGDSTSGFYIWGAVCNETGADTTHVTTTDHKQYRGVNGYQALVFDGTDDVMTSTATLSNIIANNACTVFAVFQPKTVAAGTGRILLDSASVWQIRRNAATAEILNNDGGADTANRTVAADTVYVLEARHDSGNIYIKVNNGTETSTASGNTTSLAGTLLIGDASGGASPFGGKICEIIVCNAVITSAQRSSIYTYLATKYTTTAAAICDIESATLVGPFSQDYVTTFSATTASRYYWFEMFCNVSDSAQRFPLSKVYLGTRYNFGSTDPVYPYATNYRKPLRDFVADSGTIFRNREGREQLIYDFHWFLDDSTRDDFMSKIGRWWDVNPIMLYTPSGGFTPALNSKTLVHGWIDQLKIDGNGPVANQNTMTLSVVQDV